MSKKQYVPKLINMIFEQMTIDIEYNPETIEDDINTLSNEVHQLFTSMSDNNIKFQNGEIEFNSLNDDILSYLDKKQQLDYLTLTYQSKNSQEFPEA